MVKLLQLLRWRIPTQENFEKEETSILVEASELIGTQADALVSAAKQIAEWQELALMCQRGTRDLAIAFRVAMETPEVDLRDDLDNLVRDLSDAVATLEEHIDV